MNKTKKILFTTGLTTLLGACSPADEHNTQYTTNQYTAPQNTTKNITGVVSTVSDTPGGQYFILENKKCGILRAPKGIATYEQNDTYTTNKLKLKHSQKNQTTITATGEGKHNNCLKITNINSF